MRRGLEIIRLCKQLGNRGKETKGNQKKYDKSKRQNQYETRESFEHRQVRNTTAQCTSSFP